MPMSVLSLPVSLLLILLRTHYQVRFLLFRVFLRTHCHAGSSIAASSSQNLYPDDSFMMVNTDMKKALRGGYTCCVLGYYSNTKRDMEFSVYNFPRDISVERNGLIPIIFPLVP